MQCAERGMTKCRRWEPPPCDLSARDYFFSVKRYSCCASRKVSVHLPSLSSVTKDKPEKPGTIVTNAVVPSSFLRDATDDFHSPKSKRVSSSLRRTAIPTPPEPSR